MKNTYNNSRLNGAKNSHPIKLESLEANLDYREHLDCLWDDSYHDVDIEKKRLKSSALTTSVKELLIAKTFQRKSQDETLSTTF